MKYKRQAEDIIRYVAAMRDAEGYACIDIHLSSDIELYDPLSYGENLDLSNGIYDFIEGQDNMIPAHVPLRIRFHGRSLSPEEQEKIRRIMRRHYTMLSYDVMWDMAANFRKMIGFSIFGVVMLGIYFYLVLSSDNAIATEALSIIGSFSLWEAADAFLLERPRLRRERANIMQNRNQLIEFVEEYNLT